MSKFKVGDKVVDNGKECHLNKGKVGTVVGFWENRTPKDSPVVKVEEREWYYFDRELELVEEPAMRIEAGKYYKTRSGKKVGPAEAIIHSEFPWNIPNEYGFYAYTAGGESCLGWREDSIVEEWVEEETEEMTCKAWGEMTTEEKGALLLAHHEGKTIQWGSTFSPVEWHDDPEPFVYTTFKYRVKPEEPEVEEKVFDEVHLEVTNIPYTYSTEWGGTTKGTATVTYTDGKPTKMVWESIE